MTGIEQQIGDEMIERIMRYCDGTLPPDEAARVADEIAADPLLQQLAQDLTTGANLARETMSGLMNDPVPLHLARTIVEAPEPLQSHSRHHRWFSAREAAAAMVGLLLGGAAIGLLAQWPGQDAGLRLASLPEASGTDIQSGAMKSALMGLLQTPGEIRTQSYQDSDHLNQIASVSLVSWFQMADGSDCAEFHVRRGQSDRTAGFACQRDGRWDIVMLQDAAEQQ